MDDDSGPIASEFYTLSFLEKRYPESSALADMDLLVPSSPSIAMSSRDQKNRHEELIRKRRVETIVPQKTIPDTVVRMMRVSERTPYVRGHIIPMPGSPIARRPPGSQAIVIRNTEMGSTGRNRGTFRPRTASEQRARTAGTLRRTVSREEALTNYSRRTLEKILNGTGQAIPMHCAKSSWKFLTPLDRVFCTRPSNIASSLAYAPVPDCAECILQDGPYGTIAGAAKLRINDKTSKADKLYLIDQRPKTPLLKDIRQPMEGQSAPYHMDYEPHGSPDRKTRPVWRQFLVK
jgi:hypothetical protein